eukprot:Trichotokara_eunicae@DN5505_c0_g1_i2.p1
MFVFLLPYVFSLFLNYVFSLFLNYFVITSSAFFFLARTLSIVTLSFQSGLFSTEYGEFFPSFASIISNPTSTTNCLTSSSVQSLEYILPIIIISLSSHVLCVDT